jgi:hypothetical protein
MRAKKTIKKIHTRAHHVYERSKAAKDKAESRVKYYRGRIDKIKSKGLKYKTRVLNEIEKDKTLTMKAKAELVKAMNEAKTEVKSSVFTEEDKESFREIGKFLGVSSPKPRRKTHTRRRSCAAPRIRSSR